MAFFSTREANSKPYMFTSLNYPPSHYHAQPNKLVLASSRAGNEESANEKSTNENRKRRMGNGERGISKRGNY